MNMARVFCFGIIQQVSLETDCSCYAGRLPASLPLPSRATVRQQASMSGWRCDSHLHMIVTAVVALYIIARNRELNEENSSES